MFTKQVSIFLENKKGRLAVVTRLLMEGGINIRALSLADMTDFGVLRLIVTDRPRCLQLLKEKEFVVQETDVIAVEIEDRPGGLHRILDVLEREGINIEYMYAFVEKSPRSAVVVFKIDGAERAVEALARSGIRLLPDDVLQAM